MSSPKPADDPAIRCILAVPAVRPEFFEKAAAGPADTLFIDLEDSVFPDQKLAARENALKALETVDWKDKRVLVRPNSLETEWGFRDIEYLGSRCARLDGFLVPKIMSVDELRFAEALFAALDRERPADRPLQLHILIEMAMAVARVEEILAAARRVVSVSFGIGDYSMSLGAQDRLIGAANPEYVVLTGDHRSASRETHWNDQWHFAMARVANACHAYGITAIDGPYGAIADRDGYMAEARRARILGYVGKWAIHPSQIAMANEAFSPTPEEIAWAKRAQAALEDAHRLGKGAVNLDGQLIEAAHRPVIERILGRAGNKQGD